MRRRIPLIAAGLLLAGTPVPAAAAADCAGVTVVVDFGALGGGIRTGCAAGDPGSGLAALTGAGFGYKSAQRFAGFVCRIDEQPASDPCVNASPSGAYWSYWHAGPGGSWAYSDIGAAGHDPAPGSVEGWAFGAGGQPGVAPPAPAPANPEPTRTPPQQPQQPGQPGQPGQRVQPGRTAPAQPGQTGEPTQTGAPATTTTTPPATTTTVASTTGESSATPTTPGVTPLAADQRPDPSGGTTGLLAGIAAIAALGGLGWWTVRRRRQAGS
ncbi:hypothetical protein FHS29_000137 [Saccharothrix tamanrassetensis]|uniref:LPXTG-motif cell wall-anchored protein n=1 Tax=Saccharothrix tamanrassetensis TaxID=1051531 RepID=A0A841CBL6_9PSEU|nr:hypothetical protein [Saccharothrix tamanrassetensis]MBB5953567.1 hypothetical protein [Saccharothrix tamanrassetensis]